MVFTDISAEPRKSIFRIEEERTRAGSCSLLVTTHRHKAEYHNINPKVLPYFLLHFNRLVTSLAIIDRYSDNLQRMCYCFQHHVIFPTKAGVFYCCTKSRRKENSKVAYVSASFFLSRTDHLCCYSWWKSSALISCCFVFQMLWYFLQFWGLNTYFKESLLTLCCNYSGHINPNSWNICSSWVSVYSNALTWSTYIREHFLLSKAKF